MSPLLLLITGGSIATLGDVFLKKWAEKDVSMLSGFFFLSLFVYLIGILFLAEAFKHKGLATANAIFVAVNAASLTLFHLFYFHEKLSLLQSFGIALSVVSILLIQLGEA